MEFLEVNPPRSLETNKANLLDLEQKHLDWLFSLPAELRYNFNPIAGSSLGYKHTEDTRAQMSKSQQLVDRSGENNPMYGRTGENHPMYGKSHSDETRAQISKSQQLVDRSGENHPMYGKSHSDETRAKMSGANNPLFGAAYWSQSSEVWYYTN